MTTIKQREPISFELPNLSGLSFETEQQRTEHELKVAEMVHRHDEGYEWVDAYFLAFGYGTMQPFAQYILFSPDSVSEFTGKTVVNEEDYLDVVYAVREKEKDEQDLIDAGTVRRGRKPVDPEIAHAKALEREGKSEAYKAYIAACQERKLKMKELWADYEDKKEQKKLAEAYHKKAVADAYAAYLEIKAYTPKREDF